MINFAFIIHRQKMSGFPMKRVFMFQIIGGMKKYVTLGMLGANHIPMHEI